jgi:hypothetical protein
VAEIGSPLVLHGMAERRQYAVDQFSRRIGTELLARILELCLDWLACHSTGSSISPTLAGMGERDDVARGTVRLSVGWQTTDDDADRGEPGAGGLGSAASAAKGRPS